MAQSTVTGSVQQHRQDPDETIPLKRPKKEPGAPTGKNVVVLTNNDVKEKDGIVFMPNTIEMAQLKKPQKGQFKTNVQISSKMTERGIKEILVEAFPFLKNKRFYCAGAADNRTRLDFHGDRRIWDGRLIKQKIKGNSALYIYTDEGSVGSPDSTGLNNLTLKRSHDQMMTIKNKSGIETATPSVDIMAQGSFVALLGMAQNSISTASCSPDRCAATGNNTPPLYPLAPHSDLPGMVTSSLTSKMGSLNIANSSSGWEMDKYAQTTASEKLYTYVPLEEMGKQGQGNGNGSIVGKSKQSSVVNKDEIRIKGRNKDVGTSGSDYESQLSDSSAVEKSTDSGIEASDGLRVNREPSGNLLEPALRDLSVPDILPNGPCSDAFEGKQDLPSRVTDPPPSSQMNDNGKPDAAVEGNSFDGTSYDMTALVGVVQGIFPTSGSLKGRVPFQISLKEELPDKVQQATALFQGVAGVPVFKANPFNLQGLVPPSPVAGPVLVIVTTDAGEQLGITCFEYIDEVRHMAKQLVNNPTLQGKWFFILSQELGFIPTRNDVTHALGPLKEVPNEDSSVKKRDHTSIQFLQQMVYLAAQAGAQHFIEIVFGTSAGQIVSKSYKDRTQLPEDVARANGHEELAQYLQDKHKSLSRDEDVQSFAIDWSELIMEIQKKTAVKQVEPTIGREQSSDDDDHSSDYFADAESCSCGSSDSDTDWSDTVENIVSDSNEYWVIEREPTQEQIVIVHLPAVNKRVALNKGEERESSKVQTPQRLSKSAGLRRVSIEGTGKENYLDYLEKPLRPDFEAQTFRLARTTIVIRDSLVNNFAATFKQQSKVRGGKQSQPSPLRTTELKEFFSHVFKFETTHSTKAKQLLNHQGFATDLTDINIKNSDWDLLCATRGRFSAAYGCQGKEHHDKGSLRKQDSSTRSKQSALKRSHDQMTSTVKNGFRIDKDDVTIVAQGRTLAQSGMTQNIVSTASESQTREPAMHIADGHAETRNTITSESSLLPHAALQGILSSSLTPQLNSLSIASAASEQERCQLWQTTADLAHIILEARTRQEQGDGTATKVQGITSNSTDQSKCAEVQCAGKRGIVSNAADAHQEDYGSDFESPSSESAVERPSDSGIEGSDNLFVDDKSSGIGFEPDSTGISVPENLENTLCLVILEPDDKKDLPLDVGPFTASMVNYFSMLDSALAEMSSSEELAYIPGVETSVFRGVQDIFPPFGSIQGEFEFRMSVKEALPDEVKSGCAWGDKVAIVPLCKLNPFIVYGTVPRSQVTGDVVVSVLTDSFQDLGNTLFKYIDDGENTLKQFIQDPVLQARYFTMLAGNLANGIPTSGSHLTQALGPMNVLHNGSGQVVFNSYKDRNPLPEDVARANDHEEFAQYLQDVHTRLSLDRNVHSTVIDWLELVEAVQKQRLTTQDESPVGLDQSDEDDDDSSDYFADAETSSCGSCDDDLGWPEISEKKEPCEHDEISSELQVTSEINDLSTTCSSKASLTENERIIKGESTKGQTTRDDICFVVKQGSSCLDEGRETGECSELSSLLSCVADLLEMSCDDLNNENSISKGGEREISELSKPQRITSLPELFVVSCEDPGEDNLIISTSRNNMAKEPKEPCIHHVSSNEVLHVKMIVSCWDIDDLAMTSSKASFTKNEKIVEIEFTKRQTTSEDRAFVRKQGSSCLEKGKEGEFWELSRPQKISCLPKLLGMLSCEDLNSGDIISSESSTRHGNCVETYIKSTAVSDHSPMNKFAMKTSDSNNDRILTDEEFNQEPTTKPDGIAIPSNAHINKEEEDASAVEEGVILDTGAINRRSCFSRKMSQRAEKLWKEFLQAIRECNEDKVGEILLETSNLKLGGGKTKFLTRKITTTQGTLTALHLAVKRGAERIIKLLFENGVNVNATSQPHKFTALHMAVEQDNNGIIQLLLSQKEINVNACDEYGHTPLKLAAEKGNQETVKWLIEKGADINKADSVDNTAIHVAADKGHYGVLQLLLSVASAKNSGIIGKQNKDKNTPLHLAVGQKCQNSVALLLFYGAASSLELENRWTRADLLASLVPFELDRRANERLRDAANAISDAKTKGVWKCLAGEFRVSEMTWIDSLVNKWKLRYWSIERETLFSHLRLLMKEQHLLEREQLFAVEQWLAQKLFTKTEQLLNVRLIKRERKFQGTYEVSGDPVCKSVNSYEGEPKEVALAIPFELFLDPVATQTCLESNVGVRNSKINQPDKGNQQFDKNDCKALKLCKAGRGTQVTYEAVQTSLHVNFVQLEDLTVGCRVVLQTKPLESNLRKTDEITMERLFDLSCDLRKEWKNLALVLGVRDMTNDLVDETNQTLREKCYNMLLLWKQRFGPQATYKELAVGLCHESVQREDLVKKYCQDIISSAMQ